MSNAIIHRGPDGSGFHDEAGCHLGMRRLAIIDVAMGGQPIYNEDGSVVTVMNGEIYNYAELRERLTASGHSFRTDSDTEVVVHLYEEYGTGFVDHLRGMFGLAVWDARRRRLVLARDRAGKKPLYYRTGDGLWFASELKALLAGGIPVTLDPAAIDQYLSFQYIPQPRSAYREVRKLPAAHILVWEDGKLELHRYWELEYRPTSSSKPVSEASAAEQFREQLLSATSARLVSERPLGAFLSGGLDSSAVVAAMSRVSSQPVKTFSIGFSEEKFNELPFAREVADLYGTEHHELVVTPDIEDVIPRLVRAFDEPYADSSAIPSFYLAEMARQDVVVALNGDGGDESLGGYNTYLMFQRLLSMAGVPRVVADSLRRGGSSTARRAGRLPRLQRLANAAAIVGGQTPPVIYGRLTSYFSPEDKRRLYRPEFQHAIGEVDPFSALVAAWDRNGDTDPVNRMLSLDIERYLPGDLLPKVDITSMLVSLEARSPFLDHEFMQWAASLPGDLKVRGGTTKYLMKQALAPWLPQHLIHRSKKGFSIPRDDWLRGPLSTLVRDTLLASDTHINNYLVPNEIRRVVEQHQRYGRMGGQLWLLLMLELWHRENRPAD